MRLRIRPLSLWLLYPIRNLDAVRRMLPPELELAPLRVFRRVWCTTAEAKITCASACMALTDSSTDGVVPMSFGGIFMSATDAAAAVHHVSHVLHRSVSRAPAEAARRLSTSVIQSQMTHSDLREWCTMLLAPRRRRAFV